MTARNQYTYFHEEPSIMNPDDLLGPNPETVHDDRTEALQADPERTEPTPELAAEFDLAAAMLLDEHGLEPVAFVVVVAASDFGQVGNHCYHRDVPVVEVGAVNRPEGYRRWMACGTGEDGPKAVAIDQA